MKKLNFQHSTEVAREVSVTCFVYVLLFLMLLVILGACAESAQATGVDYPVAPEPPLGCSIHEDITITERNVVAWGGHEQTPICGIAIAVYTDDGISDWYPWFPTTPSAVGFATEDYSMTYELETWFHFETRVTGTTFARTVLYIGVQLNPPTSTPTPSSTLIPSPTSTVLPTATPNPIPEIRPTKLYLPIAVDRWYYCFSDDCVGPPPLP